ncbi:MAG: hypothetical protein AAFU54_13805 [Chloroflexota bacterium]
MATRYRRDAMNSPDHKLKPDSNRLAIWFRRRMLKAEPFVFYTELTPEDCLTRLYSLYSPKTLSKHDLQQNRISENVVEFISADNIRIVGRVVYQPEIGVTLVYGEIHNVWRELTGPMMLILLLFIGVAFSCLTATTLNFFFTMLIIAFELILLISLSLVIPTISNLWSIDYLSQREEILKQLHHSLEKTSDKPSDSKLLQHLHDDWYRKKLYGKLTD